MFLMGGRGVFLKTQAANTAHDNAEVKKLCPIPPNLQISNTFLWQIKKWQIELSNTKSTHTKPHPWTNHPSFDQDNRLKSLLFGFGCHSAMALCCSCCGVVMERAVTSQPTEVGGNLAICSVTVSDFCYHRWCNICGTMIQMSQCRCLTPWRKKANKQ